MDLTGPDDDKTDDEQDKDGVQQQQQQSKKGGGGGGGGGGKKGGGGGAGSEASQRRKLLARESKLLALGAEKDKADRALEEHDAATAHLELTLQTPVLGTDRSFRLLWCVDVDVGKGVLGWTEEADDDAKAKAAAAAPSPYTNQRRGGRKVGSVRRAKAVASNGEGGTSAAAKWACRKETHRRVYVEERGGA
jgi:hypothetical protein